MSHVVVDIEGLNTFVPKYFSGLSKQDKDQFWDILCEHIREKLKHLEILRSTNPLEFLAKRNFEVLSQDYQKSLSSVSSQNTSVTSLSKIVSLAPSLVLVSSQTFPSCQNPLIAMENKFSPLVLVANLHDLPQGYAQRLKQFGAEGDITSQQHLDRFLDFIDLEEVDHEDVKMRLFAQSLFGEAKKWFKAFPTGSILNSQHF